MKKQVIQINVKPKTSGEGGLPKTSIEKVLLTEAGLMGDYNNFRTNKKSSSPKMAVLVLPIETIHSLNKEGWPVNLGDLGENLTTSGINNADFSVGQQYKIGKSIIEITMECEPCKGLSCLDYVGDTGVNDFIKTLIGRRGWYAKVLRAGPIERGDLILEKK